MSDVQTHMHVQDAIETAILDRGVEPPADLADIVFAAARAALESAPSSLRAELAEAKAEIARLTESLKGRDLERHALRNAITQLSAQRDIVEAATALVTHRGTEPVHPRMAYEREFAKRLDALVAAVEEGKKT